MSHRKRARVVQLYTIPELPADPWYRRFGFDEGLAVVGAVLVIGALCATLLSGCGSRQTEIRSGLDAASGALGVADQVSATATQAALARARVQYKDDPAAFERSVRPWLNVKLALAGLSELLLTAYVALDKGDLETAERALPCVSKALSDVLVHLKTAGVKVPQTVTRAAGLTTGLAGGASCGAS